MSVVVFASATHDFYFDIPKLPENLRHLLKTDGQGIVYIPVPHHEFYAYARQGLAFPGSDKLGAPLQHFLPLAHARQGEDFSTGKGANPAAVCGMMGLQPTLYCALGTDAYSKQCMDELDAMGVNVKAKIIEGVSMAHAHVIVQDTQTQLSLIYKGTNNMADHTIVDDMDLHENTTLLVNTSVPFDQRRALVERAAENGVQRIVFNCTKIAETTTNGKSIKLTRDDFKDVSDLVVNRDEAAAIADHFNIAYDEQSDETLAVALANQLHLRCVMTRGGDSVLVARNNGSMDMINEIFPNPVDVVNVTGAGDGFLGMYLAGIDQGKCIIQTVKEAIVVGGLIAGHKAPRYKGLTPELVETHAKAIRATPVNEYRADFIGPQVARYN